MKIKLPRKRKKAFIKLYKSRGKTEYMAIQILLEILLEVATTKNAKRNAVKFPKTYGKDKRIVLSYW